MSTSSTSTSVGRLPIGTSVTFRIPHPVRSKKNGKVWRKRRGRMLFCQSDAAQNDTAEIRLVAASASKGVTFHADDALHLDYEHVIETDDVIVTVTKVGELPAKGKRGTKRDVIGMMETIADALQGVLYPNDSAIDIGTCGRRR